MAEPRAILRSEADRITPYAPYLVPGRRPERAATFLAAHPGAVWVQTVEQCLELLEQPWHEVHLDHDLSGEVLVDHERDDCGMAVVRWLCEEPRPHLRDTRFVIHTHNPNAACMMVLHLQVMGFQVHASSFGVVTPTKRVANSGSLAAPLAGATHRDHRLIGVGGRTQIHAKALRTSRGRVPHD